MYKGGILYSEAVREFQKVFVITVLLEQKWNQTRAAETLGMNRNTLRRLMQKFQLDIPSLRAASTARARTSSAPRKETTCDVDAPSGNILTDQDQAGREGLSSS